MKYATATIIASLAAGAIASSCPKNVVETSTVTADSAESTVEVWQTTITLTAPQTQTVTVGADGSPVNSWTYKPSASACKATKPSDLPAGCTPAVRTVTSTQYVPKAGSVTTKTGSTLYVGAGAGAQTTVTVTANGNAPAPTVASGYAAGDAPKDAEKEGDQYLGNWGTTASEELVATGVEIFKWTIEPTGVTKTFAQLPEYTLLPNGDYGFDWSDFADMAGDLIDGVVDGVKQGIDDMTDGLGDLGDLGDDVGGSLVDGLLGGNKNKGGSAHQTGSGPTYGNATTTSARPSSPTSHTGPHNQAVNATGPAPGSPASNVTAPFEPLNENSCNTPSSRSSWCDGKSVTTDTDKDYRTGVTRKYQLTLTNGTLNMDGTNVMSLLVNGQRPGPPIEANWGDLVQITVVNQMQNNGTSIHWHGLRQIGTNDQDGVPGVTECPIAPGESRVYTWHASSYGTGWYHSHWMTQSGDGVHGPIIIHGPKTANYDIDAGVVQIEDTFPQTAAQWNYHTSKVGPVGTTNYLLNGHNTKADLSGGQHSLWTVKPGKKYLFRFVNSASQNMYSLSLDGHDMQVVAADFIPITPYTTKWLNIGIGQRYDVIIETNQKVDSYFLRAVTQMGCPSSCDNTGLGQANGIIAYEGVQTSPYLLPTSTTDKQISDFQQLCDDEPLASLVPVVQKSAGDSGRFTSSVETIPAGNVASINTADDGVVTRWYLNNGWQNIDFTKPTLQTLANKGNVSSINNAIVLNKPNQWYYFVIQNQFFAGHPMHLHGHDFSILGQGEGVFDASQAGSLNFANPMRRDTGMLKGVESAAGHKQGWTVIAFQTDNPGAWLMHCHIVWHVDGGLSLQWIERPDDIGADDYVDSSFNDQCSAYAAYEAKSPAYRKTSGSSGLKVRNFFEEQVAHLESRGQRKYLQAKRARRSIGHSHHGHQ